MVTIVYIAIKTKLDVFKSHLAEWLAYGGNQKKWDEIAREISHIAKCTSSQYDALLNECK